MFICHPPNLWTGASHVAGSENVAPDLLSRGKIAEFKTRFPTLAATPMNVPETQRVISHGFCGESPGMLDVGGGNLLGNSGCK